MAASGCIEPAPTTSHSHPLFGDLDLGASCGAVNEEIEALLAYSRTVAASPAFESCVASAMQGNLASDEDSSGAPLGPYLPHPNDPHQNATLAEQIAAVIAVAQSPNDIELHCDFDFEDGNAYAYSQGYGHSEPEEIWYAHSESFATLADFGIPCVLAPNEPECVPGGIGPTRSFVAGTLWHEAMHTHGYDHPDGLDAPGYYNTVPPIVESCMKSAVQRGGSCAPLAYGCEAGDLVVPATFDPTEPPTGQYQGCLCAPDPKYDPSGVSYFPSLNVDISAESPEWSHNELAGTVGIHNGTPLEQDSLLLRLSMYEEGHPALAVELVAAIPSLGPGDTHEFEFSVSSSFASLVQDGIVHAKVVGSFEPYRLTHTEVTVGIPTSTIDELPDVFTTQLFETARPDLVLYPLAVESVVPLDSDEISVEYLVSNDGAFSPPFKTTLTSFKGFDQSFMPVEQETGNHVPMLPNDIHENKRWLDLEGDGSLLTCGDSNITYREHWIAVTAGSPGEPYEWNYDNNTRFAYVIATDDVPPSASVTVELGQASWSPPAPVPNYLLPGVCPGALIPFTAHVNAIDPDGDALSHQWFASSPGATITSGQGTAAVSGFVNTDAFDVVSNGNHWSQQLELSLGVVVDDCLLQTTVTEETELTIQVPAACASFSPSWQPPDPGDFPLDACFDRMIDPLCPWIYPSPEGPDLCGVLTKLHELAVDPHPEALAPHRLVAEITAAVLELYANDAIERGTRDQLLRAAHGLGGGDATTNATLLLTALGTVFLDLVCSDDAAAIMADELSCGPWESSCVTTHR